MSRLRQSLTFLLTAGYALVAIVVGGGHGYLHNHGHSHVHGAVALAEEHEHQRHHAHDDVDADHGHSHDHDHDHEHDAPGHSCPDDQHHNGHDCVVCQYLAQQPLPVTITSAPEVSDWCWPVVVVIKLRESSDPSFPYPARGPPGIS